MVSVKVFSSSSHLLTPTKSQAEAHLALRSTLSSALSHSPSDPPSFTSLSSEVVVPSLEQLERESNEADLPPRGELDVAVKIFLPSPTSSADPVTLVKEALKELGKTALKGPLDSLVLAWKGVEYEGRELTFFSGPKEEVKEEEIDQGVVEKLVEVWTVRSSLSPLPLLFLSCLDDLFCENREAESSLSIIHVSRVCKRSPPSRQPSWASPPSPNPSSPPSSPPSLQSLNVLRSTTSA